MRNGLKVNWRVSVALVVFLLAFCYLLLLPASALAPPVLPYHISNDATGGDCTLMGSWDAATGTCTLSQDISSPGTGAIEIADDHLTLDGAGHTITGDGTSVAVYVASKSYDQVRNLVINHFYFGVESYSGSNNQFSNITVTNSNEGINLSSITASEVDNCSVSNSTGILLDQSSGNLVEKNRFSDGYYGIELSASGSNTFRFNLTSVSTNNSVFIGSSSNSNWFHDNTFFLSVGTGLVISNSNSNVIYNNNFLMGSPVTVLGTSSGNTFNLAEPAGGNYWGNHADPEEGCQNSDNNRYCDSAFTYSGATDNLPLARRMYYFTWYDTLSPGSLDWVLMANPSPTINDNAWFDLGIGGNVITPVGPLGSSAAYPLTAIDGEVGPLGRITPTFPGVRFGPVKVGYHSSMRQMVSQRVLWGNSLEEVTGIDASKLSSHYYWPWYDQQSAGYTNWILVANPSAEDVWVQILIGGVAMQDESTGNDYFVVHGEGGMPAATEITPMFPGRKGGPVEVRAIVHDGSWTAPSDFRKVIASQRVLTSNGAAFNEVPGIPMQDLSYHYFWSWYDMQSSGALNWILVANPATLPDGSANTHDMDYDIKIAGDDTMPGAQGTIAPGEMVTPTFPGKRGGPVQVDTREHGTTNALNSIVSQRSLWGPSFEEVPGLPYLQIGTDYYWTWYDMASPGSQNWVLVANPSGSAVSTFHIYIGDAEVTPGVGTDNFLYPGDVKTYTFPGTMNGPVHVTFDNPGIASQRVLWQGNFNEVTGTPLS